MSSKAKSLDARDVISAPSRMPPVSISSSTTRQRRWCSAPSTRYAGKLRGSRFERLIEDGRIHPARIEEVVPQVEEEFATLSTELGEKAMGEAGIRGLRKTSSRSSVACITATPMVRTYSSTALRPRRLPGSWRRSLASTSRPRVGRASFTM